MNFTNGTLVLRDRLLTGASLEVVGESIKGISAARADAESIDLDGGYLVPGFVDLHVHGGAGHDFMDGTASAFDAICRCHARHGTTSLAATSTAADAPYILRFLRECRAAKGRDTGGARVLGAHFYGPYFAANARGVHPGTPIRAPEESEFQHYLDYSDIFCTATIAPELPGAEVFARACASRGIRLNAGHSHATFGQVVDAINWGVRHIDHLFCAMSDRAKLRQSQTFPMRGGMMEATLFFDDLTTEVIADGKHLDGALLRLAYKCKGPERLALVTDAMRAVDCPDGEYTFGPPEHGERIRRFSNVGVTMDGTALASGVMGMDACVRTFLSEVPETNLVDVIRMATLTPARILGLEQSIGSLEAGKLADVVALDAELNVKLVYVAGRKVFDRSAT
ncbi:N-acetylglucosamine-6-phosphate deacetylase [Caulifigura coniformis]|uniref:N-acetylglucosamine-6-phosphate deacetylase n=1 Tax=Caulifigura coniformis TaxID=2527983 RepID=A0A517SIB0_9PLAN|nr:N-acetylglucosamine-6-phosphate deacetylase [Caulifigura coniformis]QDT55857.1 N-acetylglucosamine-6-phosphate deacetylase [Caulifigura coniformis]